MITNEELAWAAGFFDGEGCVCNSGKSYLPHLYITQVGHGSKEPEVLIKFKGIVGFGKIYKKVKYGSSFIYTFNISVVVIVKKVFNILWPYLSSVKKNQAIRVFSKYNKYCKEHPNLRNGFICKRGHDVRIVGIYKTKFGSKLCNGCVKYRNSKQYKLGKSKEVAEYWKNYSVVQPKGLIQIDRL